MCRAKLCPGILLAQWGQVRRAREDPLPSSSSVGWSDFAEPEAAVRRATRDAHAGEGEGPVGASWWTTVEGAGGTVGEGGDLGDMELPSLQ